MENNLEHGELFLKSLPTEHGDEQSTFQDDEDKQLVQAVEKCFKEGSNLPIIKQELRCKIQYRRLLSGQGEITLDRENKNIHYQLTENEVLKRNRRRLQNRQSALRCREKQYIYQCKLENKVHDMEIKNEELQSNIDKLQKEKNNLVKILSFHTSNCCNRNQKPKRLVSLIQHLKTDR